MPQSTIITLFPQSNTLIDVDTLLSTKPGSAHKSTSPGHQRIQYNRSFPSKMACARPVRDFQKTIFTWRVPIWSNVNVVVVGDLNSWFQLARGVFRDNGDTISLLGNETPASNFFSRVRYYLSRLVLIVTCKERKVKRNKQRIVFIYRRTKDRVWPRRILQLYPFRVHSHSFSSFLWQYHCCRVIFSGRRWYKT